MNGEATNVPLYGEIRIGKDLDAPLCFLKVIYKSEDKSDRIYTTFSLFLRFDECLDDVLPKNWLDSMRLPPQNLTKRTGFTKNPSMTQLERGKDDENENAGDGFSVRDLLWDDSTGPNSSG